MEQIIYDIKQPLVSEERKESFFYKNGAIATISYKGKTLVIVLTGKSKLQFAKDDRTYEGAELYKEVYDRDLKDKDIYKLLGGELVMSNSWFELYELVGEDLTPLNFIWGSYIEALQNSLEMLLKATSEANSDKDFKWVNDSGFSDVFDESIRVA